MEDLKCQNLSLSTTISRANSETQYRFHHTTSNYDKYDKNDAISDKVIIHAVYCKTGKHYCLASGKMTSGVTDALEPSPHTKGCSGVTVIVMPLSISPPSDGNVPVWHRRTTNYPAWRLLPPEPADTSTGNPKD